MEDKSMTAPELIKELQACDQTKPIKLAVGAGPANPLFALAQKVVETENSVIIVEPKWHRAAAQKIKELIKHEPPTNKTLDQNVERKAPEETGSDQKA